MIFRPSSRKALCLLVMLFLGTPGSASAQQGTREIMADAMARMMDAMGLFDSAPNPQRELANPIAPLSTMGPLGTAGWGSGFGMPWDGPFQDPSRAFAMGDKMRQLSEHMQGPGAPSGGGWPGPWTASRLEGVWEGQNGELLIVQGARFRIYSPSMQRVDGLIRIQGERLALYNPQDEHPQPFEFKESRGRLIMRDLTGQSYLYRRLRLDSGQSGTAARTAPKR